MFYKIEDTTLIGIANAIREQYGEDSPIATTDMEEAIRGIEGSGGGSGVDFGDWIVGQFSVASDTNEAQIIDFSELEGDVYEIKLLIHTNNFTHSGKAYSIIGGQTFAGNGLITYNYKGDYGPATQWSNCPLTVDLPNRTITFGPAGSSYRFRAGYTYQYVIVPVYN